MKSVNTKTESPLFQMREKQAKIFRNFGAEKLLQHRVNGRLKNHLPQMNEQNFRFYIGQIFSDGSGMYDEKFLISSIASLLKVMPDGNTLTIVCAGKVGEVLGNTKSQTLLCKEEQKEYLESLIKKYFPGKNVCFESIEQGHEILFENVKKAENKQEIETLDGEYNFKVTPENLSFEIAKCLYAASKESAEFSKNLIKLKPNQDGSDYYTLMEIALRLSDFLNGVKIQGGASRQGGYDGIIGQILSGKMGKMKSEHLWALSDFCEEKLWKKEELQALHFDTKKLDEKSKELAEMEAKFRRIRNRVIGWLVALSLLGWGWLWVHMWQKKEQEETYDRLLENSIAAMLKEDIYRYGPDVRSRHTLKTVEDKERAIRSAIPAVLKYFRLKYGEENSSESELSASIVQEMLRKKTIPYTLRPQSISDFSADFARENAITLHTLHEIEYNPYGQYGKYKSAFENTYFADDEIKVPEGLEDYKVLEYETQKWMPYEIIIMNAAFGKDYGNHYPISRGIALNTDGVRTLPGARILARAYGSENWSLEAGKKVAEDFLKPAEMRLLAEEMEREISFEWDKKDIILEKIVEMIANKELQLSKLMAYTAEEKKQLVNKLLGSNN